MKKRTLWIVLLCLALMLSGCGAGTEAGLEQERLADTSGTAVQVKQAEAPPSDVEAAETSEAEPSAETLPEACMLWYDARETGGATERLAFDVPLAARADDGVRFDEGYSVRKTDGTYNDLALDRTQQGDFLESLSDAVRQEGSSGQLSWEGEAYHALTIDVTDGMMPNVASPFGGVLRLNVSGDCYVDGGGADYSCFEGFDCVLITGEGSLRFENTAGLECGGGMLPVPAVVVDGDVDVCCENFLAQPNEGCGLTVAVLNGTLRTDLLRWRNGDMLIAGGVMTARSISTFNPITVTCRGGVLLLDWPSDYEMTFVLSGGEAYLAGPLNEGTVVEAGAGILAAQDMSAAEIHGDGASVLGGEEAESWYFQTTYSEDWSGAQDGMTWDALTLADAGGGWFAGTLTMGNVTAEELLPWGALWLRLAGENTVSGEVGGTGLLVEGDGAISAGNLNLWGWGGIHHPAFALRGATVTTGGFGMGCNSGEAGTFEVSGGSFTCTGETWMQNAAMTVLDGEVRFDGPCNLDSGSVVIEGGTVVFAEGLWLGNGDITVTGGEVIAPGGADGLIAENGSVRIEGGTVREP